jgi:NtrC-family two-component system response regulator AlgB
LPQHTPSRFSLKILVVDDEPRIQTTLALCLEEEGHRVTTTSSADVALQIVAREVFDIAFLDLRLGTTSGLDLIPPLLEHNPRIGIIVITAYATIDTAVEAMKLGAVDYLPKPFTPAQVRLAAQKVAERKTLEHQVETLQQQLKETAPEISLASRNPKMQHVIHQARQVAAGETTVLLQGESGTGKGVLAQAIHAWSPRADGPFSIVHSPSLPTELFESELFGHAKGAFTGAVETNPGRVALSEGGTLFLDEIGDLPLAMQPKLLRFMQDRAYERVGDPTSRQADVRIITATNQDLEVAIQERRFREDLYYRLNVVEITVPPLRHRPEDIVPLASQFLAFFASKNNRHITGLTHDAETVLRRHQWPGNVRELQNAIERAVIFSQGELITPTDLSLRASPRAHMPTVGDMITLRALEEEHIRHVIATASTLDEAAQTLGIDPATLWRKRKEYGL